MTKQTRPRYDILVIGGGMVGLTFAIAAAHHGLDVCLVDREDPAAMLDEPFDGRASAIAHASFELLSATGIWPEMAPDAQPINDIRVSDGDSRLFLHFDHHDLGDQPFGYMVENRAFRGALFTVAATTPGLTLRTSTTVEHLARDAGVVVARLNGGTQIRATLAVAADGRFSSTRDAAGIAVAGWRYPQSGIVCTVAHQRDHRGIANERFLPPGPFAILPLRERRASLVWTEHGDLAPAIIALDDDRFAAEMRRRFGDFLGPTEVVGPRWSYPLALHHAEAYIDHRLALIGDAGHGLHPIAGQGLNLGFRDVAALVEVILDAHRLGLDIGTSDVLDRYQRWRRFDNVLLLGVTDGLNRLFSNDIDPIRIVRDLGLAAVDRAPALKRMFTAHARGTVGKLPRLLAGETL